MNVLFGAPEEFAIHCLPSVVGGLCHFKFTARGKAIGDPTVDSQLVGCIHWAKDFLLYSGKRMRPELYGLSANVVIGRIYDIIFKPGNGNSDWAFFSQLRSMHHMDEIGMDSFRDKYSIILVQDAPGVERLIWRPNKTGQVLEERYAAGFIDKVLTQFVHEMDGKVVLE